MRLSYATLLLPLCFFGSLAHSFNCKLKLANDFRIQSIDDVKTLLAEIQSLDFVADRRDIYASAAHLLAAPQEIQKAAIPLVIKRLREVANQKDEGPGYTEKRALQIIIAQLHNPRETYQEGQSGKVFLDSFLRTRESSYSAKDLLILAKAFQEKIKLAKANGEKVDRIVIYGSLTSGFARLPGSDIDFMGSPNNVGEETTLFGSKKWAEGMQDQLNAASSPLAKLDFEKSRILPTANMLHAAEASKLMVEVKDNEINLILIPRDYGNAFDFSELEYRVPLDP